MNETIKLIEGNTVPEVWIKAVQFLSKQPKREFFDLVLHVKTPTVINLADKGCIDKVELFMSNFGGLPVSTVAETIFPISYYKRGGREAVFNDYVKDITKIRKERGDKKNGWGLYALRMLNLQLADGTILNQLEKVIEKLGSVQKYQTCYEVSASEDLRPNYFDDESDESDLSIFDPSKDNKRYYGGPCLSHVSFKRDKSRNEIRLNATYRSHHYIQRALGNLIGLSGLLSFIAVETGHSIGPLTINATFAKLDSGSDSGGTWTQKNIITLMDECEALYHNDSVKSDS